WEDMPAAAVPAWLAAETRSPGPHRLGPMEPQLSPGGYARAFAAIRAGIEAGDIYQANFTLPLAGSWRGDPLALYASLRGAGGAAHGGVVFDGANWLLSLSPELFFACADGDIRVKPMKGTRPRGATPDEDAALAAQLRASVKDRAENLMILDLMRNDLARVAEAGSVRVESAFAVEHYPSVHQMVSTATARLAPGLGPVDVLEALHPCGSVTGAPKIRAMELIAQHERDPRGAYCGALGHIDPAGTAAFNVAIRTLRLTGDGQGAASGGGGRAVLGVGSAIVADSDAMDEWRECMVKGGFVRQAAAGADGAQFDLIETMAFAPDEGIPLLERHLERIAASARALGFAFDRHGARNAIHALCFAAEAPARLRLLLARSGAISLEIGPAPVPFAAPLPCILLPAPVDRLDWRLAHKTSERGFYEAGLAAARAAGAGEALFVGEGGCLTEGCFTSLFVERDGQLLTPPLADGLLPGVLRAQLLA
ncbi:MAG TPA: aminodeoxychorismate synthase component I, partial [Novosphingobium sp.]|nr:aminodeoxychorismate synthase component I [Novosphingobium sp.]